MRTWPCAGEGHKAAKTRIKEAKVSNVAKVVGVSKLKTKYEVRNTLTHHCLRNKAVLLACRRWMRLLCC